MSRIPDGLAHALTGIAERLEKSLENGRAKAAGYAAALSDATRDHFTDTFIAQWLAVEGAQAAKEIRIALEVWSTPAPRARRRRR